MSTRGEIGLSTHPTHDYELSGYYSTLVYAGDDPEVVERQFGERSAFVGRTHDDVLLWGRLERIAADGGECAGIAKLSINDHEVAGVPFGRALTAVTPVRELFPGDRWRWVVEVRDAPPDHWFCGVSVLAHIRTFWRSV